MLFVKCIEMNKPIHDLKGTPVKVGTKVKLLSLPESLLSEIPEDEVMRLKTMIGEIFQVYEIDKWGGVWVEKYFKEKTDKSILYSHSLSLDSHEMEVVEE
jgi:hypothetical protein